MKLRQNRLNLNFTYDPTKEINGAISQDGPNVFNSVYEANFSGDPSAVGRNLRGVGTLPVLDCDTRTRSGNGFVFAAVDNPSRAFRLTGRVSCPTGYESNLYPDVKDCIDRNAELFKPIAQDGGARIGPNDPSPARERVPLTFALKQAIRCDFQLTLKRAGKAAPRGGFTSAIDAPWAVRARSAATKPSSWIAAAGLASLAVTNMGSRRQVNPLRPRPAGRGYFTAAVGSR